MAGAIEAVVIVVTGVLVLITALAVWIYARNPFEYPYFIEKIDVSGMKTPSMEDAIDRFLNNGGIDAVRQYRIVIRRWKLDSEEQAERSFFKTKRLKQFRETCDDSHAFRFVLIRLTTRYRQVNYQKYPYKVESVVSTYACDYDYLEKRNAQLAAIGYQLTLREYASKEQRKLVTPAVRKRIAERDHYTCQICGKYMPDGVGLQIDHIIPVSRGGKSVDSNLRVLCSKCNAHKSAKMPDL